MERRLHHRHSIHLDVNVVDRVFHSWVFAIEDFGLDGLYLSCKDRVPDSIQTDDILELQFNAEEGHLNQSYSIKIKVLRKLDRALAIAIYNPAYEALLRLSKQQKQLQITDVKAKEIYTHLEKKFLAGLSACIEAFFTDCNDFLFTSADKSSSNVEQAFYFDTINSLNSCRNELKDEFLSILSVKLNLDNHNFAANNHHPEDNVQELGLLEQNDYENWLVVDQMIKASVPQFEQQLSDINQRLLSLLSIEPDHLDFNPFYPETIFKSFNETVHHFFSDNDAPVIFCKEFEKTVNNTLPIVYDDLNQLFIDNGVMSVINKKELEFKKSKTKTDSRQNISQANKNKIENEIKNADALKQKDKQQFQPASRLFDVQNQPLSTGLQSVSANSVKNAVLNAVSEPVQYVTEIATLENNINLNNAYQTLKDILSFQTRHAIPNYSAEFRLSDRYVEQLDGLIDELTDLHQSSLYEKHVAVSDFTEFVLMHIKQENYIPEVLNELMYTLDILGRLFTTIQHDEWLPNEVKNLICSLQLPLVKVALLNKDFFSSWSNPARLVINKLALINFNDANNHFYLRAKSYIDMIIKSFHRDLSVFSKVQGILGHLLDLQSTQYNANVEKIIAYWDAQEIVCLELAQALAGKKIPLIIADFISHQWIQVLLKTCQAQGKDSIEWQQYTQAVQICLISDEQEVSGHDVETETILFIIKKGLSQAGLYNKKIVDNIEQLLQNKEFKKSIILSQQHIFQLLINGYALSDELSIEKVTQQLPAKNNTQIKLVNKFKINDYLVYKQKTKNVRLQLVWKSIDQSVLVLIGRSGQQEAVLNTTEVARLLENKQLYQTHHFELPLLERSVYAILGEVHGKLAEDNQFDHITHFMFRKEFEQILTIRLSEFHQNKLNQPLALCMINIDRFSLINNTFGFECGDQYLAEVAQLIAGLLPEDAEIARYGVDEFIILLHNQTEEQAVGLAEQQRQAIQGFTFEWQDKHFNLSASIGVTLTNVSDTSMNRLVNAVSTAMSIAKEQGRNRVYFFTENDAGLTYRQQLQVWATKVEQMIENQQLDVRFHRIQPLTQDALPHYEVLLVVKDKEGRISSPAEFIEAAELYNKMAVVDQWVIDHVFNWCRRYPDYSKSMGSISVNLSGHSLNSVDFIDYVSEKFKQYNINPSHICFEITETVAIANLDCTINLIQTIKEMGCKFALDDFGTGMSSYAYLKNLPVDFLKIDGVFIKDIVSSKTDQAMVKSINEIGHFLGIHTIAEYVENDGIVAVLNTIGVDYAQGFGIEKPIMMDDLVKHISIIEH